MESTLWLKATLMGERTNGGGGSPCGSMDSPPSINRIHSGSSSPLLQTEPIPEDDHALCPYCQKDFRKPRVLDCLHSMCEDCIIAQLDGRREAQKAKELAEKLATDCVLEERVRNDRPTPPGVIRCPLCTQESHVGNDIRYVHSMLIDYVRVNEAEDSRGERNCRACKSEQPAVAFCKQCGSDLCGNCLQAHRDMRMFDGHAVMSYAELEASGRKAEARRVLCPLHGSPFLVLCTTCEAMVCKHCLETEHHTHKVVDVNHVVVHTISKELLEITNKVNGRWTHSLEAWRSLPDRYGSLHSQFETAKARIEMAYEEVMRALEESKTKKMQELEEARDRQEHAIDDLYRKVDQTQTRVNAAVSFANRLIENANGMELLSSRRKVIQQLSSLEHTMPTLGSELELQFQPASRKNMDTILINVAGNVLCRTVPSSVRDGSLMESNSRVPADSEWNGTSNGGSATVITPIGGERAAKKKDGISSVSFTGGWPPSSNPPELPSPSPPKETASTPTLPPLPQQVKAAAPFPYQWPAANTPELRLLEQRMADPRVAAAFAADPRVQAAAKLQLAQTILMQQQPNMLYQRQLEARRLDPIMATIGNELLGGSYASSNKGGELKLAFVNGNGTSGQSMRDLHSPGGFCINENDEILIADTNNHRIVVITQSHPWKFGKPGQEDGALCFPRRVVALRGEPQRYVVIDRATDNKSRGQLFDATGEFIRRINFTLVVPKGGIEVWAATSSPAGHLVMVDHASVVYTIDLKETPRVVAWFDGSAQLQEASDVAVHDKHLFITDFKSHCVHVFAPEGEYMRKIGEPSHTPYPIGVDIGKNGEILVAHTHGNKLTVVQYTQDGQQVQQFINQDFRMSRCASLRITSSGLLLTLSKHAHSLYGFKRSNIRP